MTSLSCRLCGAPLRHTFINLGAQPLSNAYLRPADLLRMEPFYPLKAFVCAECWLVQIPAVQSPEQIFTEYAYFSSYSDTWLSHCRAYAEDMVERLGLDGRSLVVEVASNDGALLQYVKARGIPVLGVEPAANVARVAEGNGIPTLVKFFGAATARELAAHRRRADLLIANNVLAHVPDLNDFVAGVQVLLHPAGTATLEVPHLLRLIQGNQFDTIYHEHFSYLSLLAVETVFARHGLVLYDVEEIPTHGGSLRIYARHRDAGASASPSPSPRLAALREKETTAGLDRLSTYGAFADRVHDAKWRLVELLIAARRGGKTVVGYGAAAKGNTLLNFCGVRTDLIEYVADRSPHKQGLFLPGTRIPIYGPEKIAETRPDYVLILPWNLRDEVVGQLAHIRDWGGRFIVPNPRVEVLP